MHGSGDVTDLFILAATPAIELGQILLPAKYPDTTDWLLESLGGILGYILLRIIRARLSTPRRVPAGVRRSGSKERIR